MIAKDEGTIPGQPGDGWKRFCTAPTCIIGEVRLLVDDKRRLAGPALHGQEEREEESEARE